VLLAKEMMDLANSYNKDVHAIHKLFYGVSCNYERLKKCLENEKKKKENETTEKDEGKKASRRKELDSEWTTVKPWGPLEDLALKKSKDSEEYKHLKQVRGDVDITERRRFLELEQ